MVHVALLGQQVIADDEDGPRFRSSRGIALVAHLVAHAGTVTPRPRLAALFWPDSTDAQGLTNLRRELHHLRHAFGHAPVVRADTAGLSWRDVPEVTVDLRVFDREARAALEAATRHDAAAVVRHASAALEQYRGPFLPGTDDDWVREVRDGRESCCARLCELLSDALASTGDATAAVDVAQRRVRLRPLEEAGYRQLMERQLAQGDRAGAVSAYERCAAVLARELGVTPDAATQQILATVAASPDGSPAGRPAPRAGRQRGRAGAIPALVGREAELTSLIRAFDRAVAGEPGLVLVRGEAGVGKTRLVAELAAAVRARGGVVAESGCPRHLGPAGAGPGRGLAAGAGRARGRRGARPGVARRGRAARAP
jgi:DNA-binding SARP family transcriptional activator